MKNFPAREGLVPVGCEVLGEGCAIAEFWNRAEPGSESVDSRRGRTKAYQKTRA